jgi:hypothetical protein
MISCGKSELDKVWDDAVRKQNALDSGYLDIWKRSPIIDGDNNSLTAFDNLDNISRGGVTVTGYLDPRAPIESSSLKVYDNTTSLSTPSLFDGAGEFISTKNSSFQVYMAFAHGMTAITHAVAQLPSTNFKNSSNLILPTKIYALQSGNVTATHYDPTYKSIYLYTNSASANPDFRIADEADAIYHEWGHAIQDALNKTVINNPMADFDGVYPANRDLDAILEALADFNAAAVAKDDRILMWLAANMPPILSSDTRTGTAYRRNLDTTIRFPSAYIRNPHLDGRVLSAALNDFRKYLSGSAVTIPSDCTSSCTTLGIASPMSTDLAFDRVSQLAHYAYAQMTTTTTFFGFESLLESTCDSHAGVTWCDTTEIKDALSSILDGRGLRKQNTLGSSSQNHTALNITHVTTGVAGNVTNAVITGTTITGATEIYVPQNLGWMPFPNDTGFANSDSAITGCEVMLIYPNLENRDSSEYFYDWTVSMVSNSGFSNMTAGGSTVEEVTLATSAQRKVLGWIGPSETTPMFINFVNESTYSGRWYQAWNGSTFARKLSSTYYPSELGWLVRAPSTASTVLSATFRIQGRRYNTTSINQVFSFDVTQSVTTATSGTGFCSN